MMERKKDNKIPKSVLDKFTEIAADAFEDNPDQESKYKIDTIVSAKGGRARIARGAAGIYIIEKSNGEYEICLEKDIEFAH